MAHQDPNIEPPHDDGQPPWEQRRWGPPSWEQSPGAQSPGAQSPGERQPGPAQAPWGGQPVWGPPSPPSGAHQAWPAHNPYGGPPPYQQPRYTAPPKPGIVPLRPLMFGEILDGSFHAIRRNAKAMLGAALLAQSLAAVFTAVFSSFSATSAAGLQAWAASLTEQDLVPVVVAFTAGVLLVSVLTIFLTAVLQGAMVVPVARSVLNRPTGFKQMWVLARPRAGVLIRLAALLVAGGLLAALLFVALAVLLVGAVGGMGALILIPLGLGCFVLFIWIYIKLMVAPAVVVVEELGALESMRRSWDLTRGNWWRLLGITLVVGIMVGIIAQVVMIPITLLGSFYTAVVAPHGGPEQAITTAVVAGVATAVVSAVVAAVGFAFQTSVMALLYLDLRMRRDGLDIALLRLLESGADPDGVPGRGVPVYTGPGRDRRPPSGGTPYAGTPYGGAQYGGTPNAGPPYGSTPFGGPPSEGPNSNPTNGAWPDGR